MHIKTRSEVLIASAVTVLVAGGVYAADRSSPEQLEQQGHAVDVARFVGSWRVTQSATTSACQGSFLLEHPDPSTLTLFHLQPGATSDLVSDDGDCSFTWYVQDRELRAQAGQFCFQHLPDGSQVEVGLIYAHGTLQPDGSAKDSILISVTLDPAEGASRTCMVTIEETLVRTKAEGVLEMKQPGESRQVPQSKYTEAMSR